jgi:hypothetical protein
MDTLKRILLMAIAILIPAISNPVRSANIETLLMPGDVIQGHAKLESQCSSCHVRFRKGTQTQLCLDCHKAVNKDIKGATGYHGRLVNIATTDCKSCHSEHLGRDADIVRLDPLTFKHTQTDFALQGAHTSVACSACHKTGKKYAEAPSRCSSCHGKHDPHKGNLGQDCQNCHTTQNWGEFDFDHDKTDFLLQGAHRSTACNSCHINERYKKTPKSCYSCHALDDVHKGINGPDCADCHNARKWGESDFDHDRDTKFALKGKHAQVRCETCHVDPVKDKAPDTACVSCHRGDDAHHGRYGTKCQSCHSETSWKKARFDHARSTEFPLEGQHSQLVCSACHRGDISQEKLSVQCISCHQVDDVHHGQEGKQCERCHRASGWGDSIVFDHGLTRFPLLGLHATVPCEECHVSSAFKDTPRDCISCHRDDDEHKTTLGTACHTCHNPNSWAVWLFDHNKQTDFELLGAHRELHCSNCHNRPADNSVSQSKQCNSCHKSDDIHRGQFGSDCARCHSSESFRDVQIKR